MPGLFDSIRLISDVVESLWLVDEGRHGWKPEAGTLGVLVHEHGGGAFEAELFENEGDYAPVALAVVRPEHFEVTHQATPS